MLGACGGGRNPPFTPPEVGGNPRSTASHPPPAQWEVCLEREDRRVPGLILLCMPLFFLHTLKEISKPLSFIEFSQERKPFLGTLIFRVISYLTHVNT